jgi:hypothetical protein
LEQSDYEPLIAEWVEEVLKRNVNKTHKGTVKRVGQVDQVLNFN